jgi:integrase
MAKKKKRQDGLVEIKITVGKRMSGTLIRKSFYGHTAKEASDKANEYMKKSQYQTIDERITLEDWADKWLETYKSGVRDYTYEYTYKNAIEKHIKPYFKDARLAAIRPVDIQEFFNTKAKMSQSAIHKLKITLRSIFDTAIENDLIYKNPVPKKEIESKATPGVKRAYTKEEVAAITAFAKTHPAGAPIIAMLKAGLRRSEVLALRWQDVDFKNKTLSVNVSVSCAKGVVKVDKPKSKASMATIPIDAELAAVLQAVPHKIGCEYIFPSESGKVQIPDTWEKKYYNTFMADYLANNEGARRLTPHELRHTFGSLVYEATKDIYITSKLMRHSDVKITANIYVHEKMDTKRKALGKVLKMNK